MLREVRTCAQGHYYLLAESPRCLGSCVLTQRTSWSHVQEETRRGLQTLLSTLNSSSVADISLSAAKILPLIICSQSSDASSAVVTHTASPRLDGDERCSLRRTVCKIHAYVHSPICCRHDRRGDSCGASSSAYLIHTRGFRESTFDAFNTRSNAHVWV